MDRLVAPIDFNTPISRVRCVTDTSMMLARPTPPIASVRVPMKPRRMRSPIPMASIIRMNSFEHDQPHRPLVVAGEIVHARQRLPHLPHGLLAEHGAGRHPDDEIRVLQVAVERRRLVGDEEALVVGVL